MYPDVINAYSVTRGSANYSGNLYGYKCTDPWVAKQAASDAALGSRALCGGSKSWSINRPEQDQPCLFEFCIDTGIFKRH